MAFLNGNLDEEIYIQQPERFEKEGKKQLVCKIIGSIYGLKQAFYQWYLKFHDSITSLDFKKINLMIVYI